MNFPAYHSLSWVRELPTGLPCAAPVQQDEHTPDTDEHQTNLLTKGLFLSEHPLPKKGTAIEGFQNPNL